MSFYKVLAILFTFTVVIFVHELGHLLSALKFKVDVKKFSLGFGKELIGYTYKGIRFTISAIPLGGYVSMKGEDPSKEEASEEGSLMNLDPLKRIVVLFSGAAMNFIAGALIFS
ncbi:MAG: site-2 protease family protein, partial [Elusimicrobiota bacterium]